jgi:bifunctional UDP-N-acetylglucosamine pyrophosphorylase / glucosamine-1-phosphate N-acetyltransferase
MSDYLMAERVAIILAAGVSSRMKTDIPKVLHEVCGRSMLSYVIDACRTVGVGKIYVVVGYGAEQVKEYFARRPDLRRETRGQADAKEMQAKDIVWVLQKEQKGTAHAVLCCKEHLANFKGQTFVICGDMPLIRDRILQGLIEKQDESGAAMTLATAVLDDPAGYGRIARDKKGKLLGIVEHNDCNEKQLEIKEVNPSYYFFDNKVLFETLGKIGCDNAKGEYYITDSISILLREGKKVEAVTAAEPAEAMGVNSRAQLSEISKIMQGRIQQKLMADGVTIIDLGNTWIDYGAEIGRDTTIEPFTYIRGNVKIGRDSRIGPFVCIKEGTVLADGSIVEPGYGMKAKEN